ncbi:MAG: DUF4173 domain-containing protein [Acidimicrobiia bacterium]|nr:DUF4173 domain-containing protein [Acidimicrobiia bacterium]
MAVVEIETSDQPRLGRPWLVLALATGVGVGVDLLVVRHPVGLGASVLGMVLATGVTLGRTLFGLRATRESFALAAVLGLWSILISIRTAPLLVVLNAVAAVLLLGLTFRLLKSGGLPSWTIAGYVRSGFATLSGWIAQPIGFLTLDLSGRWPRSDRLGRIGRILIGVFLALPLLGVFAALFSSADPVFEGYLNSVLSIDIDLASITGHLIAVSAFTWLGVGAARYALVQHGEDATGAIKLRLGRVEAATMLVLLNGLFLVFVIVQSAYLFGGRETLNQVGLTYAEYARRGFFELVAVGSLIVGLVLVIDWLVQKDALRVRAVDILHGGLISLTLVVLVSALGRMRLYTATFGLTELRLYTTVFMGWVFLVLGWLVFSVLRGRRAAFAFGAFVSALVVLAGLTVANPAGIIVRTNITRQAATLPDLDATYLVDLGSDAVPALIAALDEIQPCQTRSELAEELLRVGKDGLAAAGTDWKSATWSRFRADQAFAAAEPHLRAAASDVCS